MLIFKKIYKNINYYICSLCFFLLRIYKIIWLKTYVPVKEQKSPTSVKRSKGVKSHLAQKEHIVGKQKTRPKKHERYVLE
tara:strand:+ start:25004 stop:25243 length:240 start_codon:yes stop_codon:yes gene_type:complete